MAGRLQCLLGLFVFLLFAWMLSSERNKIRWSGIWWGLSLQSVIAVLALKTSGGGAFFVASNRLLNRLNDVALNAAGIPFGFLANPGIMKGLGESTRLPIEPYVIFVVGLAASMILISSLSSLFYHWGLLQRVMYGIALVMRKTMRTSGSESLGAAANIFLGQNESALVIKPYLEEMTRSEIMALMTVGMATIASGMVVVYNGWGLSAGHLVTASMMSAPGALVVAKLMLPETVPSKTSGEGFVLTRHTTVNAFDAICRGALDGIKLAASVVATVVAFVALVALANLILVHVQRWCGVSQPQTFESVLGYLNAPVAWLIGVPWHDCRVVGGFMGERVVLNEFLAYRHLIAHQQGLTDRSFVLATYALCGFANFSSIAIQIGGIGTLAEGRRHVLAELGWRAMIGGLLSCYISAAIVGILM
jgi:CNT family concentrative nucleoside transporter